MNAREWIFTEEAHQWMNMHATGPEFDSARRCTRPNGNIHQVFGFREDPCDSLRENHPYIPDGHCLHTWGRDASGRFKKQSEIFTHDMYRFRGSKVKHEIMVRGIESIFDVAEPL